MNENRVRLEKKIREGEARVGTIGLGYVGLPLSVEFAEAGLHVTGFDLSEPKVDAVNRGESYIQDVATERVAKLVRAGRLRATTDFAGLSQCDAIVICVPTPLGKTKDPDLSMVVSAAHSIRENQRAGQLVVLESTTYPGTTEELIQPILERTGLKVGESVFLAFSPERVDPGNAKYNTRNTPKIIGGVTRDCTEVARLLYGKAIDTVIPVSSTRAAEMVKLLENTFRSVNIGLVNEVALMCERLKVDVWEVIEAAATKPFGFMPFFPGPGLGGHCLAGSETVCVRDQAGVRVLSLQELFAGAAAEVRTTVRGVDVTVPDGLEALSVDSATGQTRFAAITHLFRRLSPTPLLRLWVGEGRSISVTDGHPMLVRGSGTIVVRPAVDVRIGDELVVCESSPIGSGGPDGAEAKVMAIESGDSGPVYSMEVAETNTFVTSYGIAVHNCIPIDPLYLSWKLKTLNYRARFIELAGEINSEMPEYVVQRVADALNEREKSVKGSQILILGVAYKKDVDDVRESPALDILKLLESRGARVSYNDPHVPELKADGTSLRSQDLLPAVRKADLVVIVTNHSAYPYRDIVEAARVIVDTRNATKGIVSEKILKI